MTHENTMTTVAEMNAQFTDLSGRLEAINTRLNTTLADGDVESQAARLVAFGLSKQAHHLMEQVGQTLPYLADRSNEVEDDEPVVEAPATEKNREPSLGHALGTILSALIEAAGEVVELIANQFGVKPEAVPPFLYEMAVIILPIIDDIVSKAEAKLDLADSIDAAADAEDGTETAAAEDGSETG